MKNFFTLLLLVNVIIVSGVIEKARFDFYRVYEIHIENENQLKLMKEIENFPDGYQFMEVPTRVNSNTRLIVPPHKFGEFSELIEKFEIKSRLEINNLQEVLDNEQPKRTRRATYDWTRYWTLDEIYNWLELLVAQYPNDITLINIGKSYEGRDILGVKVNIGGGLNKKSVMLEGTHHAREWISGATITWILNEFLTSEADEIKALTENYEWYFVPITNPDGYEYTWTNNRMWRKNRQQGGNMLCTGIDLNRNWDNYFNEFGTSKNPCSDTYAGATPFSEPETLQLSEFIKTIPNLAAYFAFHSYSQLLMIPYGFTYDLLDNYEELYEIGVKAINSLRAKHGTIYEVGSISNIIYLSSGASIDWVKYELKTNVTYEWEMRDTGRYGFILPADQIVDNAEEVFASLVTILEEAQAIGIA